MLISHPSSVLGQWMDDFLPGSTPAVDVPGRYTLWSTTSPFSHPHHDTLYLTTFGLSIHREFPATSASQSHIDTLLPAPLTLQALLCAPRPIRCGTSSSQLHRLHANATTATDLTYVQEYGLLSTHIILTFAYFLTLPSLLAAEGALTLVATNATFAAAVAWILWISVSRMSSLMNSATDVLAGAVRVGISLASTATAAITVTWIRHTAGMPAQVLYLVVVALICHLKPLDPMP
jgi:hypothetical protein